MLLPSSHYSPISIKLFPHLMADLKQNELIPLQVYPGSILHPNEHPRLLPLSHYYPSSTILFPHLVHTEGKLSCLVQVYPGSGLQI